MFIKVSLYPASTGSKTIALKSAEYEEARLKSTARKSPIDLTNN
ncbi:spermidine/putrescine ABC transporter ATP-binding protein [Bacillus toyonensis]|nr:spermidine/putrescine ABC transporter ATP-binding protein [Bacillus sp. FDAARGOS_235]KAB2358867.1 spermidine/putrescine ABC transporter ATP-binding protein [Bacillus toyonensis]MBH0360705.1 spermidine/putrescine ABC transporter ATP-binding protein [Bacillus toyonensis biovar Thuringiensis]QEQ20007.1 spermidine/putrescine ABC transporter ATP-binding protein [Bacillus sp. BS98]KAB2381206.1 spermidine/putrescine ABC transporter ATP-binding protein [Bacillus toyonensis]